MALPQAKVSEAKTVTGGCTLLGAAQAVKKKSPNLPLVSISGRT
jgi:hypothetical protein